jgi:tripartite-type tricarboxylate transporter receptor subunit TctC
MTPFRSRAALAAVNLMLAAAPGAVAQDYPARTIRMIVPFAAGGGADAMARLVAQRLHQSLGQATVVENRPGAGGNIGAELVVNSPPDGYTLLFSTASMAVNRTLYPKLSFDVSKDLAAVSQVSSSGLILTTHASVPARTVKELAALSRGMRGGLNFGTNGAGTTSHLSGMLLSQVARVPLNPVHYKGVAPAMTAVVSGEVEVALPGVFSGRPHIASGKLRALAVTTRQKSPVFPELPTLDSMYPGFDISNWYVLYAPARTPQTIISRLHGEVVKTLQQPDVKSFMHQEGSHPVGSSPADTAVYMKQEVEKFARIIKSAGITIE